MVINGYYSPVTRTFSSLSYTLTQSNSTGGFVSLDLELDFSGWDRINKITIFPSSNGYGATNHYFELKIAYASPSSDLNDITTYSIIPITQSSDYFATSTDLQNNNKIEKDLQVHTLIPIDSHVYIFLRCPVPLTANETFGILNSFGVTIEYFVDLSDEVAYIEPDSLSIGLDSIWIYINYSQYCDSSLPEYYYYSSSDQYLIDNMAITNGTNPGQWHELINETVTIENLSPNTTYYIHVAAAINKSQTTNGYKNILINNKAYTLSQKKIITTDNYTSCSPPTSIGGSSSNGTISIEWSGATGGNYNPITGYNIIYKIGTNGTQSNPIQVNASTNHYVFQNLTIGSSYYFAIQTLGEHGNSNYKWIETPITVSATHPTVTSNTIITKAQMDALRTYKSNSPTAVTLGGPITAAIGNNYKANSVSTGTVITAAWYNNA